MNVETRNAATVLSVCTLLMATWLVISLSAYA